MRSPGFTWCAGFGLTPLTLTCPPTTAAFDLVRVLYRRTAHIQLSSRADVMCSSFHVAYVPAASGVGPVGCVAMEPRTASAVAVGGAAGALARWALAEGLTPPGDWPWAVFVANIVGSLLLGILVGRFRSILHTNILIGATVGFCGALTTFSSFALDLAWFVRDDRWGLFIGYLVASVATGVAAFVAGRVGGARLAPSGAST